MQIHVVSQGESLYSIAREYNTNAAAIAAANELETPDRLVIGQALVIPIIGEFYNVQPGDSLFTIANRFGLPYQELARINNIPLEGQLSVGQRLYIPPGPRRPITSIAYVEPRGETVSETLENAAQKAVPYLTYLGIFNFRANRDGSLTPPPTGNLPSIAAAQDAALMMVVTNLEEGQFSEELGHIIVTVQAVQNTLLDNIVNEAKQGGYSDIHFDLEFLAPGDRETYNTFLRKAKERFSQEGLTLSTALAPKTSAEQTGQWYEAHDYAAHGEIADFIILLTYEWGYTYGPPMAVSPINEVRRVVDYALTEIPADKIVLGQNLYGYDWTLPFVQGGPGARAVSPQQAIGIARDHNAVIEYDTTAQAPFFNYVDDEGREHVVWFEDARSIQAKFNLIKELGLKGISYWKLGLAFPQNRLLLAGEFDITKLG